MVLTTPPHRLGLRLGRGGRGVQPGPALPSRHPVVREPGGGGRGHGAHLRDGG